MGESLEASDPFSLLTNKSVRGLLEQTVWFVIGEGSVRKFSLGSVFRVAEIGKASEAGFKWFAKGTGHSFDPPVAIDSQTWFPELFRVTGHFGIGVQEIRDEMVLMGLRGIASAAGYSVATPPVQG